MKIILILAILMSANLLAQSSPGMKQYNEEMKRQWEEQQRMKKEMDSMRMKDTYLKALDQTLQGMERISKERTAASKAKIADTISRLKIGRGQYKLFIHDFKKLKKHEFNMPLGGKDEKYSCFYTKKRPISFHTVALDEKINSEIKFDLTNIGVKGEEKLSVFVKGRNIEATFEIPTNKIRRTQTFKDGFIKIISDIRNEDNIVLKANSQVTFNVCGEADLEGMASSSGSGGGYQGY